MNSLNFRTKIILLAVLPVLFVSTLVTALSIYKMRQLGEANSENFSHKIMELRREELKSYTQLALTAINHVYTHSSSRDEAAQYMAKQVFRDLRYGRDGYFLVLDYDGINLVNPVNPHLEGQNLWNLQDVKGNYLIRSLIRQAKNSVGGYTEYVWDKPSEKRQADKLSFSMGLDKWRWMVGTGIYLDDVQETLVAVQDNIDKNTRYTTLLTMSISLFFTILVAFLAIRFTVSQGRFANKILQQLSRACVQEREVEREVVASNLKQDVLSTMKPMADMLKRMASTGEFTGSTKSRLLDIATQLDKTREHVRDIANKLHPEILVKKGMYPAIEELAENLSGDSGINIDVKTINRMERPSLNIETACYRIACEALMNIIRHSKATEASIRFRQARNILSLTIQDNGVGFDLNEKSIREHDRGVGLADMQLQVELLNGSFTIFSSKGTGTMIKLAIPLVLAPPPVEIPAAARNITI